jgi:hypothetical protein
VKELKSLIYLAVLTNRTLIIPNILGNEHSSKIPLFENKSIWPGFRVAHFLQKKTFGVDIVEPAYYWRLASDYKHQRIPKAQVLTFSVKSKIKDIEQALLSEQYQDYPRIVINMVPSLHLNVNREEEIIEAWASNSVGQFLSFKNELNKYGSLPVIHNDYRIINRHLASHVVEEVRLCSGMFEKMKGNRSCFDKCD